MIDLIGNEITWLNIVSIVILFSIVTMILTCACCQKPMQKDDLLGLDGMVKITNPDENVNHMTTSANSVVTQSTFIKHHDPPLTIDNIVKSNARPSGGSNSNRSLPDIPRTDEPGLEATVDACSEIYATVEDKIAIQPLAANYTDDDYSPRTTSITSGVDSARPSLSQQSSLSQADAPYARLKSEHPYDKLKKEHPYASVQKTDASPAIPSTSQVIDKTSNGALLTIPHSPITQRSSTATNSATGSDGPPIAPPRSRRASSHLSLQGANSTSDIPAATAVAGRVAASQDLPYMTPPTLQQNFSGDSQDSSKGYTSISVREPLANILAQTQTINNRAIRRQELMDPHYATVSDDSDEMYAAIEEPNQQIYTNGSDTYAQIQPNPNVPDSDIPNTLDIVQPSTSNVDRHSGGKSPAPQPPSVDSLRQVAQVHSRQASSSSCTSSIANIGSPKPEKRQANSPLPPRPPVSPEPRSGNTLAPPTLTPKNLEDMYAKVHKNKKKKDHEQDMDRRSSSSNIDPLNQPRSSVHSIEIHRDLPVWSSRESMNESPDVFYHGNKPEFSFTTKSKYEHCYEKINKNDRIPSPPKSKSSHYDTSNISQRLLPPVAILNHYDQDSGPESLLSNDPGYEVLHRKNRPPSDCDPNYEVLKPSTSKTLGNNPNYSSLKRHSIENPYLVQNKPPPYPGAHKRSSCDPGYESVAGAIFDEPNYESMPSDCTDEPAYASVAGKSGSSETDSNYESVSRDDPNYESVKYYKKTLNFSNPGYERIGNRNSKISVENESTNSNNINMNSIETVNDTYYSNVGGYDTVGGKNDRNVVVDVEDCRNPNRNTISENLNRSTSPQNPLFNKTIERRGSTIIEEATYKV